MGSEADVSGKLNRYREEVKQKSVVIEVDGRGK